MGHRIGEAACVLLSVASEDGFGVDPVGVAETASLRTATDAAGSRSRTTPARADEIRSIPEAAARVEAAKRAGGDLVLTAHAENHIYAIDDLDDTVRRLEAYRDAGADVVYAPGLHSDRIARPGYLDVCGVDSRWLHP